MAPRRCIATGIALSALCSLASATHGQTAVNFHDAFPDSFGDPGTVFVGQGAYADPNHNTWNPFAVSGTPSNIARASDGSLTLITSTVNFGFSNGGQPAINQGLPDFLLGNSLVVNGATPLGTFSINNVPPGAYDLYLYGTNYDHNRGTIFTVATGTPDMAINATLNSYLFQYTEGVNYVLFHNVVPDANGVITGTWAPNPADGVGNSNLPGEGNFNGLQLVGTPGAGSIGACCVDLGCAQSTSVFCANAGGTFHGVASTCAAANCPLPGACCVGCVGCSVQTATHCTALGGSFAGGGVACAAAGCTIINGDFETGDFTGWTLFGDQSFTDVWEGTGGNGVTVAHGGSHAAEFGAGPPDGGGIMQTIPAHTGDHVTIGFWYADPGGTPNELVVRFDGQTLLSLVDDTADTDWTHYTYTVTSTSNNPTLSFTLYNSPAWGNLDDVTVCITPAGAGGVCCRGATCNTSVTQASCTASGAAGAAFVSSASPCNATATANTPCCTANYNKVNGITIQDIFDFLGDWFAGSPYARTGGNGTPGALSVQNIFDFLSAWFAGGC